MRGWGLPSEVLSSTKTDKTRIVEYIVDWGIINELFM